MHPLLLRQLTADFCVSEADILDQRHHFTGPLLFVPLLRFFLRFLHTLRWGRPCTGRWYKMAVHIAFQPNAVELMKQFKTVKEESRSQKNPRKFVDDWFRNTFPDFGKYPLAS